MSIVARFSGFLKRIPVTWRLGAMFVVLIVLAALIQHRVYQSGGSEAAVTPDYVTLGLVIVATLVLSCGLAWLLVRYYIKRPVRAVVDGMNRLAEKEFEFRLDEDEQAEFGDLAASFNDMADMLSASLTELKKNQDYLRSILESSADIIVTLNPSGIIQTINGGAEKALRYDRHEVVGQSIDLFLVNPFDRQVAANRLKYAEDLINYETQFLTKGGEARDVLTTISRLRNATGAIIGTIVIGKDITREKRLRNKLVQSERLAAIGQVFTGIQHSMKNMLNACTGGAYMVTTGLNMDDRKMLTEGWAMVQEGITRMTEMSSDMLKYVKEWRPRPNQVDLSELLSEIYRVIQQTASDRGVRMETSVPKGLPPLQCDARMIHSAVMDIVSNALDACAWKVYDENETPAVRLGVLSSAEDGTVTVEVTDNGCGMTPEVKKNIFTPFFSTKSRAGTGLGLSLTARIISAHGGRIDVDSTPNRGTTFRIVLPIDGTDNHKENQNGQESIGS